MGKISKKDLEAVLNANRFINSENELRRLPMEREQGYLEKIRLGKFHDIVFSDFSTLEHYMGISTKNHKKKFEYTAVAAITLATRAAIEGGLPPDDAYDISETMLQLLEKAMTTEEIHGIIQLSSETFARKVYQARQEKKPYLIEKTRMYVDRNITKKIYLKDIAEYTGVNPTYLSRFFSQYEGVTIHNYIQHVKIEESCKLLVYTEYSIADISQYLGYQSQSNFSSIFKKLKMLSPSEYRKQNQRINYTDL
jgi:AraC-like DNA-binding protein